MKLTKKECFRSAFILFIVILAGCASQLAPKYDAALFEGLADTNVNVMELFASVSNGSVTSDCRERGDHYNSVIGALDALIIQSRARPVPDNSVVDKVNTALISRGLPAVNIDDVPTAYSLEQAAKQVTKMRQLDCSAGLKPGAISVFKNAVIISMDQAITYESFLDR